MMTNREYMVGLLSDWDMIDDMGASYEAMVHYNVNCPYFEGDPDAHCHGKPLGYISRDNCVRCKEEWLDKEVAE